MRDQEKKVWNITRTVWRRRFRESQGWHSAMVWVERVMVMVGVKAARVAGPGFPRKLSVAPLNFHCPHEVMMRKKENKEPKINNKKRKKVTELHKLKKRKRKIVNKNESCWQKGENIYLALPFSKRSAEEMINTSHGDFSSSRESCVSFPQPIFSPFKMTTESISNLPLSFTAGIKKHFFFKRKSHPLKDLWHTISN